MGIVFDYSFARPSIAAMHAIGAEGVIRYIAGGAGAGKEISLAELASIRDAGLALGLVWETTGGRAFDGEGAGVVDAAAAEQQADRLGYPRDCPIYYACDADARQNLVAVESYFRGVRSAARRPVGCYAGAALFEPLLDEHTVDFAWQASALSWSDHRVSPRAAIVQRVDQPWTLNGAYDFSDIQAPWGGWGAPPPTLQWLHLTSPHMKGTVVADLQKQLLDLGYNLGPAGADGDFGPATTAAVRQFQQGQVTAGAPGWDQLSVDGVVGAQTRRRIAELL